MQCHALPTRQIRPAPLSADEGFARPPRGLCHAATTAPAASFGAGHSISRVSIFAPQAKLTVNMPGDSFEHEADSMADKVMRMELPARGQDNATPSHSKSSAPQIQRKESGPTTESSDVSGSVSAGLSGGGQSLDSQTRAFMEPRFGHDFSGVKVHTDSHASRSAEQMSARAYTLGSDIAFHAGEYHPGSASGRHLLAHELTHVVQQGAAGKAQGNAMRSAAPEFAHSGRAIQRAVDTDGGTWDTTKYLAHNEGPEAGKQIGADVWVTFKPKAPVEADTIGLIQSVKTLKSETRDGAANTPSLLGRKIKTALTEAEGDKGRAIDQTDTNTSPLYAVENQGGNVSKTLTDTGPDTDYGDHGYRKKLPGNNFDIKDAALGDAPRRTRAFVGQKWEHSFEVAALVLDGALKNTYLGSVAWGWKTDDTGAAVLDPAALKLIRAGNPTAAFSAAGDKWNKTKMPIDGKKVIPVQMPTMSGMTARQLLTRINELTTQLTIGADPVKAAEKQDLTTELGRRNIAAEVFVTSKRGKTFDDQVYLKVTRPNGTIMKTQTRKMNSGDTYTYTLPLASFLPLDGKITIQAWDHNRLKEDVCIFSRDWTPPFFPTIMAGGVGNALYNVSMNFDR